MRLLPNELIEQPHPLLVGVARVCLPILSELFSLCQESLLVLLEVIKQVMNALWDCVCLEFVLGLPSPGAHTKYVVCKISILNGLNLLCIFGPPIALVQTGQYFQVVV